MADCTPTTTTPRRQMLRASAALLLIGAPAPSLAASDPDADLLAGCARFTHLDAEYARLCSATDWPKSTMVTPEMKAFEAEFERVGDEHHELGDWLAEQTPRTPEGAQARARAAVTYMNGDVGADMISRLQYAIVCHVAGEG
jgi:hypothetical protein